MNQLLLIVAMAGQRVALPAADVQSVIELDTLAPVPRAPAHIAGLAALRSRVLTVIDCLRSLGFARDEAIGANAQAVVVEHDGHSYALLVDSVEDVAEARSEVLPVRAKFGRGWDGMALGMVETEEGPLLLINVAAIIAGPEEAWAA